MMWLTPIKLDRVTWNVALTSAPYPQTKTFCKPALWDGVGKSKVHSLTMDCKSLTPALQGLSQIFCICYAIKIMLSDGSRLLTVALCTLN